ncbi:MAG TPA: tRNA 2-thiocytidine biosynthesis protein TtcA [Candidatus Gallacutalibacter pullistercoris]|nr:tRNA 2-thiocytidine biosynthesis protein TtcA [Candidatus Gallacutalibacter pullistercoris]
MQKLMGQMRAAMERYEMVKPGDKIAVGVSGGKDSLMLLTGLAKLRAFYPVPFSLIAITADPCFGGQETDFSAIEELCRELDVPYLIRRTRLGSIIFEERKEENPCSLCARMRRGILHEMAKENGCTALALGHHFDDAVQTFFMNLFYGGKLGCFSPKSYLSRRDLWMIRPMVFCEERDIRNTAARLELPVVKSQCPADGCTSRKDTELLVAELEKQFPDLRKKVMGAMQRAGLDHWGDN